MEQGADAETDGDAGHEVAESGTPAPDPDAAPHDEAERPDGHAELASLLSNEDLLLSQQPHAPDRDEVFVTDDGRAPDAVFPQSVASGGPTREGVILWTRIDPESFDPDEPLGIEIAHSGDFGEVVYRGVVDDTGRIRAHDHVVKVDIDGALEPNREYRYRFVYDGVASRVGTCHTLPEPDASPDSLRFGVLACQNYLNGYYPALGHVAEEDLDFLIHVGDFIYESGAGEFKGLDSRDYPDRNIDLPSGEDRVQDLADYRYIYRTYRSDRFLQRALEEHTLIAAWDDHEIANDIYWDPETDAPKADHPRGEDPEFMTKLTADAIHAWWEFMPARLGYDPEAESLQDRFQLWRSFEFGDLLKLVMTDERLYRDPPRDVLPTATNCRPENEPPGRTMLGEDQLAWFLAQIRDSEARWTVWSDEVLTIPFRLGIGRASIFPVQGGWDGYTRERQYIKDKLREFSPRNFVTLTGDMHCYIAGYKKTEYGGPVTERLFDPGERVGVEFMTPAVSSLNVAEALGMTDGLVGRITEPLLRRFVTAQNPHLEFFDSHHWGYSVVEFTREDCTYVAYGVDKHENAMDAEREVIAAYRVPDEEVELIDVTDDYAV
ncbi:alkaline phosphatase D family protein [Haloglomus halophilum]|uniref:alkaline phosphatase D family protein n=1 Tax=Haloglomus halophilum TaxID=2962672 RepID=UPI0020C97FFA|nr:alkaline phosphatase D family protein [Haloglomus halophilum]